MPNTAGSYSKILFSFLQKLPNCFPQRLHHYAFPRAVQEGSSFPTSSPFLTVFFGNSHPCACDVVSHCDSDLYLPTDRVLTDRLDVFFREMSIHILCPLPFLDLKFSFFKIYFLQV